MLTGISTHGQLLLNLQRIRFNQEQVDLQGSRITTGKKQVYMRNYGVDAPRILEFQQDITAREQYISTINTIEGMLQSYEEALNSLAQVASEILEVTNPNPGIETSQIEVVASNLLLEISATANLNVAGRYIFNGLNYEEAPMRDLRNLPIIPVSEIGTSDEIEREPVVPYYTTNGNNVSYHTAFTTAGGTNEDIYDKFRITIDLQRTITYGITASEEGMQNLVQAAIRLRSAAQDGLTDDQRQQFMSQARSLASKARNELRVLQTDNGIRQNEVGRAKERHEVFLNITKSNLNQIQDVDVTEAATILSALNGQLNASYSVIARQSQLSLINFL